MNRLIASFLLALTACSSTTTFVASEVRVVHDAAEAQCIELGGRVAPVDRVDEILAACRDAGETGPCWVALSSSQANYAITIDGHFWAVPVGVGEAITVCEVP